MASASFTPYLKALTSTPPVFAAVDARASLEIIFTEPVPDVQVAAFLTGLKLTGLDRDPAIIAAAVDVLQKFSLKVDVAPNGYVDIVGTGGDGKDTFNVSTTSALVAAGAGLRVAKHGNKASTSASGAADVLASLGASIQSVTPVTINQILTDSAFAFLFAPVFHPIMAKIAPVRKNLGVPTIFNILGPLLNPVPISARIIGVNSPDLGSIFARTLILLDQKQQHDSSSSSSSSLIVWGEEGLDEISPAGRTRIWRVRPNSTTVEEGFITPQDFGLQPHDLHSVASGTADQNSELVRKLVNNELPTGHAVLDYVLLNSAALIVISGKANSWKQGVEIARQSIASGQAKIALHDFVTATSAAATLLAGTV
ncbi:glycosyl transferase family, a/b domain-containing protein [Lipomyces japonicus]|uniref:glycosyl transferase family, a/b domain-containing protein n=1 Tax=Lipomyces japonicus TaxID=56871 RepID=UPI0034CF2D73